MQDSLDILRTDYNSEDFIEHHGIKGMKWGVRRFQNYDGTLTALGKKKQQQLRSMMTIENNLTDKEYDLFYGRKNAHKDRGTRKTLNEWLNYRNEHSDAIISVAKNKGVVFASHQGDGWEMGWATDSKQRGKGITDANIKEAIKEIRKDRNNNDEIYGYIDTSNIPSMKAAERNNFFNTEETLKLDGKLHYKFVYDGELNKQGVGKIRETKLNNLATDLYDKAKTKEPKITNAVKASANKLYGLEHKLKTKESIKRKIDKESTEENKSIKDTANNIKDTVRYTTISNNNNFVKDYNDFKSKMSDKGYKEVRCKNNFTAYQEGKVKHKSVQSIFEDKDGFKFEVQFQTPESQKAKDKKTPLYEERRNPRTSRERAEYLESEMTKLMNPVPIPKDISSIKSYDKIKR